ncbi:hypothetical protein [Streptomyces sp. RKAG337]|uniref:hypothetical protein n=1 Tax=Streptomyces sp. RKAG337 TaxID=2893404 RepID=UPI002034985B|nr:hypothetical protein [Streptomyces sp. RKAG337]MCM2430969.1 hypothetical protein [Streptomyces sp. RKAG337]
MNTSPALRMAVTAYTAIAHVLAAVEQRFTDAKDEGDRGDNNISTIMWIVGIVVFAGLAIAAFKTLGQSKLDDMKGL